MEKKSKRDSNLEILRIISILLIIAHHYVIYGGLNNIDFGINTIITKLLICGGKIGVNCFVLISGYFLINSKFKIEKLLKLILEVVFYSIIITIILVAFNKISINIVALIKSILPVIFGKYWFITAYVGLYIFSPFINKFIRTLTKEKYKVFLIISTIILVIIPMFTTADFIFSNFIWMIYIYMIGAYIQLYPNKHTEYKKKALLYSIICYVTIITISIIMVYLGQKIAFIGKGSNYFAKENSIFVLLCSIFLFIYFKNLKIKYNKFVNIIASTSFGIYCIHENNFMRDIIWKQVLQTDKFVNSNILIFHAIYSIIIVFSVCAIIDLLRIYIIENNIFKVNKFNNIFQKINKIMNLD